MNLIKAKILEKLEIIPETELREVLDFVDFLNWRQNHQKKSSPASSEAIRDDIDNNWLESDLSNLSEYEPLDWQPGELDDALPVKYIQGQGMFKMIN